MRLKICSRCKLEKPSSAFRLVKTKRSDYRRADCIACEKLSKQKPEYLKSQQTYQHNRRRNPDQRLRENIAAKLYGKTIKGRARRMYLAAKQRATKLKLPFTLTLLRIEFSLTIGSCERTGIPFDFSSPTDKQFNPFAPSVDKRNPFGGYTNENVQIVCNAYNLGKGQMTDAEFVQFCRMVVQHVK